MNRKPVGAYRVMCHDHLCPWRPGSVSWNCACDLIRRVRADERRREKVEKR